MRLRIVRIRVRLRPNRWRQRCESNPRSCRSQGAPAPASLGFVVTRLCVEDGITSSFHYQYYIIVGIRSITLLEPLQHFVSRETSNANTLSGASRSASFRPADCHTARRMRHLTESDNGKEAGLCLHLVPGGSTGSRGGSANTRVFRSLR